MSGGHLAQLAICDPQSSVGDTNSSISSLIDVVEISGGACERSENFAHLSNNIDIVLVAEGLIIKIEYKNYVSLIMIAMHLLVNRVRSVSEIENFF